MATDLVRLLHEVDGQLGLAVYRGEHDEPWKAEAKALIGRIREAVRGMGIDPVVISRDLLESLTEDSECHFDHHGGCQEHGYLSLDLGEMCPQAEARRLLVPTPTPDETGA